MPEFANSEHLRCSCNASQFCYAFESLGVANPIIAEGFKMSVLPMLAPQHSKLGPTTYSADSGLVSVQLTARGSVVITRRCRTFDLTVLYSE